MSPAGAEPPVTDLPVEAAVPALKAALADARSAVLQAEPGAGKTTIVPLRLLDEPWLADQRIVMLEPRRLATRAAARRMSDLCGTDVGGLIGYRTRDEHHTSSATRVEVITEGILTRRLQRDPSLPGTGLVIFDEIHERNLQTDLALALFLDARSALRPELRVLAMSATLDVERVAALLGGTEPAPVVVSEGRTHPIDIRRRSPVPRQRMAETTASAVHHALRTDSGDLLVFLAGAADIRRTGSLLKSGGLPGHVDVRPLFGALSSGEQDAALAPAAPGRRRIVLSTDIAETSLTVEGVQVVIDSGQVRTPRYEPRTGMSRLRTGRTSRASADQRAGRAGRTGPGVAYRLWPASEDANRRAFAEPEITTVDLAGLALELALWGADADDLAWLDPPPARALADAHDLLVELGALDPRGRLTAPGRAMTDLPVHPRLAAMVVSADTASERLSATAMAAMLEERDVLRGRPDQVGADIADRVRLIVDKGARHPDADTNALRLVRRRARELARRVQRSDRSLNTSKVARRADRPDSVDPTACGAVLAHAYPDRISQARGNGRFRLRHGLGLSLPQGDPLSGEAFLVVADVGERHGPDLRAHGGDDQQIRLAAAMDEADVLAVAGDGMVESTSVEWDERRSDLRRRTEHRLDALVLASREGPPDPGEATTAALVDRVRSVGLGALRWTRAGRALQDRIAFARIHGGDGGPGREWPAVDDDSLMEGLDEWLAPLLAGAVGRADLERVDMGRVLRDRLGHKRSVELDRFVPTSLTLAGGRTVTLSYNDGRPAISVRAQHLYGTTTHPTIAGGQVPVTVTLLSPADRPIQVTADLPGFWAGSWREVRSEMAGRYPKHHWPTDPARSA